MAGRATTGWGKFARSAPGAMTLASLLGALLVGGCVSYTNVPVPESAPAYESANHGQSIRVTRLALRSVIDRFPAAGPDGRYAVNLPAGTSEESALKILEGLPEGAMLPYEGMGDEVPVYHIGRIWIRASDAKVDVLYPITDIRGHRLQGNVTAWLYGGLYNWRVERVQHWAPGTMATPAIYIPLPEETLAQMKKQAEMEAQAQAEARKQAERDAARRDDGAASDEGDEPGDD